ncbi:MAG: toprim domain-containing protein [Flavobacteriaceae bacterium]|nr:toprim domain-containing protein [Flavobacteriaceae bacterium]
MKEKRMTCERARNVCLVETLAKLGHLPSKESEKEAWFPSPFRSETQASFKVSKTLNRWYDHGEGIGGNVIDLVCKLKKATVKEALEFLNDNGNPFSFHRQPFLRPSSKLEIRNVLSVRHPALLEYLSKRRIPTTLAKAYLKQVHFTINSKSYFALGLRNDGGGWELRNKFQKYCCSPKATTHIKKNGSNITLVEGMFDMLSLIVEKPEWSEQSDILVLNSLAFASKVQNKLNGYGSIYLLLDNDAAGDKATRELLNAHPNAIDKRSLYQGYKDLNEKLMGHETK